MKKHAYLIMAHSEPYILEKLLEMIDDERNDIYVHIDKKSTNIDVNKLKGIVKKSNIFFIEQINICWGSFQQIECEVLLLKNAIKNKYQYYHLLSGVDLPLKTQDEIYEFFNKNEGKEFVHFMYHHVTTSELDRIKYYHVFIKNRRSSNILKKIFSKVMDTVAISIQKIVRFSRIKDNNIMYGANWFSITHELAEYVVSKEEFINKQYKRTLCADEIFLQTLVYNSKFYDNLYLKKDNDYNQIMRHIDWNRGTPYTFEINDFDELMSSSKLFARKFSTKNGTELIDKIYNSIKNKKI